MSITDFLGTHTYRMALIGTMMIGAVAGALGSFAYLRRQSLISDVVSHAALPGALLAFLAMVCIGGNGRDMTALTVGAVVAGTLAVAFANTISRTSKIRIDTAMAVTVTVFFGVGLLLMDVIADGPYPGKGGIADYLFGNASVLTVADLTTSGAAGGIALALMLVFWKEFTLRCFDPGLGSALGFSGRVVDALMFTAIATATVVGVKAVGLVLMVALVVTPPAAARQWTRTLASMVALSAALGAAGSGLGTYLSIALGPVPTGPAIVVALFVVFLVSLVAAPRRSIVARAIVRRRARAALTREQVGAAR